MIQARMRSGAAWSDALILNVSSKGLLVRSDQAPNRGTFLEIRRGPYVIVARVVWSEPGRFGVQTQDPVPTQGLIQDSGGAEVPRPPAVTRASERRASTRAAEVRHESSRQKGRAAEFAVIAFGCALAAVLIGGAIAEVAAKPMDAVQAALAAR